MIEFFEVHKAYPVGTEQITALQPCNLQIPSGQIFGLIGHSGAGKSTLLRLINRLEEPSSGRIEVAGQDITALDAAGLRAFRRQVGMIFQHFNLLSSRTVAQNVAMPLQLAGELSRAAIKDKVQQLLLRVGLQDHADKYPAQLSGGQKQRVGIARALSTDPRILLCDEATSALDPQTTGQVLQLLSEINRELGLTLVLITHEMDVIRRICDQVAVMDAGVIVEQGPVPQVFLHPQHATTRRFVQEAEQLDENQLHQDFAQVQGRILRLTFQGETTYQPLLGRVVRETGVDFTLLAGRIDRIRDLPYGQLTVAFDGAELDLALQRLQAADVHVEVLR
ncbi:methionine ABC transporter ATP-binding protein [Marinospirillum alkaliphilum]|uniref:Cell division ATP-binding protein FtsE n=1 Tax=Marinospirillum alkaliphilum DSM 21637 TaxID=1122209 RepID=A0A1K1YMT6_9GAMM|nr:methionine ABC transporter ATP-binding protein [Marinospirillum alkaliphilum]SFX63305.1 D-methionine transport system ATP-binding protein [Marinospirillum alkaliphilum DSM 21637]